jgi:hypothetical protein
MRCKGTHFFLTYKFLAHFFHPVRKKSLILQVLSSNSTHLLVYIPIYVCLLSNHQCQYINMYVHHYLHQNEYLLCVVGIQTGFRFCGKYGVHHLSEAENEVTSATRYAGEEPTGM